MNGNLGTDGLDKGEIHGGPTGVADNTVAVLLTVPTGKIGPLKVSGGTGARGSLFFVDTIGTNSIDTMHLGTGMVNAGLGTPSDGDGAEDQAHVYIGTDRVVRVSNKLGGSVAFQASVTVM